MSGGCLTCQLGVDPMQPDWGFQEMTAVTRAHRGHRLGLLIKVAMLDLLAAGSRSWSTSLTGNADANSHMIAINANLGFRCSTRGKAGSST